MRAGKADRRLHLHRRIGPRAMYRTHHFFISSVATKTADCLLIIQSLNLHLIHIFVCNEGGLRASAAYLDSLVKTNFLSLRSRRTIPLEWASWTAETIWAKRLRACGSFSLRRVRT